MYEGFDDADDSLNLMAMPLGDLKAGTYKVDLEIKGGSLNLTLTDNEGADYSTTSNSDGTVTFQLSRDVSALSLVGVTADKTIEVTYHAQSVSSNSKKSRSSRVVLPAYVPLCLLSVAWIWLVL